MDTRPHIDAVVAQAAFAISQGILLHLVDKKVLPKDEALEMLDAAIRSYRQPDMNPAQKAAAVLLGQVKDMLHTADKSGAH